ncbi:hypothetical protein BEL04_16010 [Mucilaginibacter sp. PPCGB 2223]|uniref:M56 family metallopeptidase n=1 Tax=Mucilaginibacter sp. PPCGB 2223 TaxID=1886027 RepID=UPI0008244C88|nr:M56 family metallopeptidase [Mucilaginibacter sp. PPCGB 2223]OCX51528.1 hypothetical protein BEL04_16010 [Mucilaginibacter sp. PPCGB 2223]
MSWIHYLVEANLYLAAFYVLYLLFLRRDTHYQLNRAYLLSTSLLAFVIPFIQLGFLQKPVITAPVAQISLGSLSQTEVLFAPVTSTTAPAPWTFDDYLLLCYSIVALALLIHLCIRVYLLVSLSKKGSRSSNAGFNIIQLHQGSAAFSFFNNLFIDDRLATSQIILYHEQVHIRQKHSWDIIYFEILKIINWFNPVVYLLIASIKEVHEFIADEATARLENNNDDYTDFLISNAYGITQSSLTNSFFNKNLLKRRITMLYQKKSGKAARLKYLLTIPLVCGLLCVSTLAFTTKTYALVIAPYKMADKVITSGQAKSSAQEDYARGWHTAEAEYKKTHSRQNKAGDPVFTAVEVQPEFPGGEEELKKYLSRNLHYPEKDKANKVQGKVYARFVVEANGSISAVKILKTPSPAMGDEVKRLLKASPKWKPGTQNGKPVRVEFTVPVDFELTSTYLKSGPPPAPRPTPAGPKEAKPVPDNVTVTGDDSHANPNAVYRAVDVQPEFPGGTEGLAKFIQQNMKYPALAKQNNVQGKAYISFVVERDGSLGDIKVVREPGSGTGDEAVRVMKLSPKWTPGVLGGEKVRVMFTLPVNFSLGDRTANKGYDELYKYIQKYVRYPSAAKDKDIQGRTFVQFFVNADKHIQDIKVIRTPDDALSNEVIRVLQKLAILPNAQASVTYVIPVYFYINHGDGDNKNTDKPSARADDAKATPMTPKAGDRVMLDEVVVTTFK